MKSKIIFLLAAASVLSAFGAAKWDKVLEGQKNSQKENYSYFKAVYPKTIQVPGKAPKKKPEEDLVVESFSDTKSVFDSEAVSEEDLDMVDMTPDKLEKLKEELSRYEVELKKSEERQQQKSADDEDEFFSFAEQTVQSNKRLCEETKEKIARAEKWLKKKEELEKEREKELERQKEKEKEKEKVAEEIKAKPDTVAKSGKEDKSGKSEKAAAPMYPVEFREFFKVGEILVYAEANLNSLQTYIDPKGNLIWERGSFKIFFVTNPNTFTKLKERDPIINPCRMISCAPSGRDMLVCCTADNKKYLSKAVAYAVCARYLQEFRDMHLPGAELADSFFVGLCAKYSGLDAVVEPKKIINPSYLLEEQLLTMPQVINPPSLKDANRCLYFLRQSKALVEFLCNENYYGLLEFITNSRGGNPGLRTDFQMLDLHKRWCVDFDTFSQNAQNRIFYPLTKEPKTNERAMTAWQEKCAQEDKRR